jgi:GNAT superfamily N-acetyltransferase
VTLTAPSPLTAEHDLSGFDCGRPSLDRWLKERALRNEALGASRSYVVCDRARVVAYYCLSTGSVAQRAAPGRVKRNMPDPIMLMGRLAVEVSQQETGLGRGLLKDAILRTLAVAEVAGIRALLVHALDEEAARFYRHNGFKASPIDPLILMLPLDSARKAMAATHSDPR